MENRIQKINILQQSIVLKPKEIEIAEIVYHVNQLTPYALTSVQIEDWSRSINEIYPSLDLSILKKLIKNMKLGKVEWNYRLGIQNIFLALSDMRIIDHETEQQIKANDKEFSNYRKPKQVF